MNDIPDKILEILNDKNPINFDFVSDSLRISHEDFSQAIDELSNAGKIEIDTTREIISLRK
mgnify:CR=1 FL=1